MTMTQDEVATLLSIDVEGEALTRADLSAIAERLCKARSAVQSDAHAYARMKAAAANLRALDAKREAIDAALTKTMAVAVEAEREARKARYWNVTIRTAANDGHFSTHTLVSGDTFHRGARVVDGEWLRPFTFNLQHAPPDLLAYVAEHCADQLPSYVMQHDPEDAANAIEGFKLACQRGYLS